MRHFRYFALLMVVFMLFSSTSAAVDMDSFDGPYAYLYYSDFSTITIDGTVGANEYPDMINITQVNGALVSQVSWAHNTTHLAIAISAVATGWVALGFGPVGITMTGADMIMGYVDSTGELALEDRYSLTNQQPSVDDDSNVNMNFAAGTEVNGVTTLEYIIHMRSNDTAGQDLNWAVGGTYGIISAFHSALDDFSRQHTSRSAVGLTVQVLDSSVTPPTHFDMSFDVVKNESNHSITVTVTLTDPDNVATLAGIEIGIYKKATFGQALIDVVITDATGVAQKDIGVVPEEEMVFVAILHASLTASRVQSASTVKFTSTGEGEEQTEFGDLRDVLGAHLMRNILVYLFLLAILSLLTIYGGVVVDIFNIYKDGKEEETVSEENKEETA
ncbi:MAG: hypothetical protein INQ03_24805 [Candidatus Heimdallarchaeota archaeon]|nr:hypothetical protein [Candidatus Heimdallarchaeota archaeon]